MSSPNGFDAMGRPIPTARRLAGLNALAAMGLERPLEVLVELVDGVAERLEQDDPDRALKLARTLVDVTGAYRLVAALLTDGPDVTGAAGVDRVIVALRAAGAGVTPTQAAKAKDALRASDGERLAKRRP